MLGICGNNDGEQWTDFQTPRRIHMSEMMPREFIREWIDDVSSENGGMCSFVSWGRLLETVLTKLQK